MIGKRLILPVVMMLAAAVSFSAEPEFLASSAAGLYEIDGERILRVEGFEGRVMIRAGGDGQIRFLSTDLDNRSTEVPLEMWKDGRTLMLLPVPDSPVLPLRIEAAVPPGFSLDIRLDNTELTVSNIFGDITLEGAQLDAEVVGVEGSVAANLISSIADFRNISGDMDLESKDGDVRVQGVGGRFSTEFLGGKLEAGDLAGPVGLDGEDAEVILNGNADELQANLSGGSLQAIGVGMGGEFRLQGTTLELKSCKGDIRVESDAMIGFTECTADLHFDAYGASVRGNGNQGILEIKTDDADVVLKKLNGPTRIQGDRLEVDIQEAGGELWVLGTASNIKIDNINNPLTVVNDFGDVHIIAAAQKVEVENRDGNVTIERQTGPVAVHAESETVMVTWTSVNWGENSFVENTRGDVALYLPNQGGCTVDAEASYGRVESDIEGIVVGDDGRSAAGSFNRARKPVLRVRAEGDLRIMKAPILE